MDGIWRVVLVVVAAMLVPVIPFALFGEQSEAWIQQHLLADDISAGGLQQVAIVILVLASDILLPVPSSAVLTFAGAKLGLITGTLAGALGLTASCLLGYWLGSRFGMPLVKRLTSTQQFNAARRQIDRRGPWMLLVSRALPVVAEACVLVAGVYRMPRRVFFTAVLIANFVLALSFCVLGLYAADGGWFLPAMLVSVILPCLLMLLWRARRPPE
jgi:uncharacterized membrane protein YdjX (TVP38/TMEM64 family)